MSKYAIRTGCIVTFEKSYFKGNFKKPVFDGKSILKAVVKKHSYGFRAGQHTFTLEILEVLENGSAQTKAVGQKMLIKGRNLYPNIIKHIQSDESKLLEKNSMEYKGDNNAHDQRK